ncbi:hypothetical protein [Paenibacillus sp. YYML68]|uniref:hypothetical protein n=1 Tax=Paenibacillus sp. YYML68 TaxID=2909250 RepID=UPI00248FD61C|nr:hypothetical protein [Paenibacillus sp. YYML68]
MNNEEVYTFFKEIGVEQLHHANTVLTACTFLSEGGLLSRGFVEDRGLPQTWQNTDEIDKKYDIWHDLFFDDVDIHNRTSRQNFYGSVLFTYDLEVLLELDTPPVAITKSNPKIWTDKQTVHDRYFSSLDELRSKYKIGKFGQMITLRNARTPLTFEHLKEIIVDAPEITHEEINLGQYAFERIARAAELRGINEKVKKRDCWFCNCYSDDNTPEWALKRFFIA